MLPDHPRAVSRRKLLAAGASFAFAACRRTQPGFGGYAFVASEESRAVGVVQFDPFRVVKQITVPAAPTELVAHPTRPAVYVTTPGDGSLYELDTAKLSIARRLQPPGGCTGIRLATDGSALWAVTGARRKLTRIAVDSFRKDAEFGLAGEATDLDLAPWTGLAAVAFGRTGGIQMIDLEKRHVSPLVTAGQQIGTARFRSDGKALILANTADRLLTLLEAPSGRVITHLPLAVRPDHFCFNRDGGQLFITGEGMDGVVVVYPHHVPQVAETVLAGKAPGAMSASENFLFVTSPSTGDLIIMNIESRKVVAVTTVGSEPSFVAVTPRDTYALVLNRKSGDMAVIRIGAIQPNRQKTAALLTIVPVGAKPVAAVVTPT